MTKVNASIKAVANKIAWQVGWDGMEAIVYKDGSVEARQIGSFGNDFAEYLIETELSSATDRHNGEELEWNED